MLFSNCLWGRDDQEGNDLEQAFHLFIPQSTTFGKSFLKFLWTFKRSKSPLLGWAKNFYHLLIHNSILHLLLYCEACPVNRTKVWLQRGKTYLPSQTKFYSVVRLQFWSSGEHGLLPSSSLLLSLLWPGVVVFVKISLID